tara:strand:- start:1027 stop:2529 length:1503 start_codon:yes stop_codon:yes gene_type:complete
VAKARGIGRVDRMAKLPSAERPVRPGAAGLYPSLGRGLGEYGSTAYPTVLESYNRNSDYRRWKLGQEYYFGTGRGWADYELLSLSRYVDSGLEGPARVVTTLFPSSTSPENSWQASCRVRGSLILPVALSAERVSLLNSAPDPADHRLAIDVSGMMSLNQLAAMRIHIGEQFEDSASGPAYPNDLIPRPANSVALTLALVDTGGSRLIFDLSAAATRLEINGHTCWAAVPYDPTDPLIWKTDGSRYLCSSFQFFCSCPDHMGGAIAGLENPSSQPASVDFPLPNAARSGAPPRVTGIPGLDIGPFPISPWESQGAGYYKQWRTLPRRFDQRRDCKHIHALRWQCGVPWLEPNDYPTGAERDFLEATAELERRYSSEQLLQYFRMRRNDRRLLVSVAAVSSVNLYPPGDPRSGLRPDDRPMLWNDTSSPEGLLVAVDEDFVGPPEPVCKQNDWWIKRGTGELKIFNRTSGRFEDTVTDGSGTYPVVQFVEATDPGAPVIIR